MANELTTPNQTDVQDVSSQTLELMSSTMKTFLSAASVDAVFAKPVKAGDTVIIPAAEVLSGMGFGVGGGSGTGPASVSDDSDEDETMEEVAPAPNMAGGSGIGGGGGGRVLSRPVAIVIASPDGVRVEPIVDVTKIGLAMFTAIGFMVGMMARMRHPGREE